MLLKLRGDGDGDVAQAGDHGADDDKCRRSLEGGRPRRPLPASTSTCPDPSSTTALPLRPMASKETQKKRKKLSEFLRTSVDTGLLSRPRCQAGETRQAKKKFSQESSTSSVLTVGRVRLHGHHDQVDQDEGRPHHGHHGRHHNGVLSPTSSHRTMVSTGTVCCPLGALSPTGGCHHRVVPGRGRRHATTRATHRPRLTPRNQPGIRDN